MNKADLVTIRPYRPSDLNFILATWLRGLRYGNEFFGAIESDAYFKTYHAVIEAMLGRPDTKVSVACLKDDEEVILGYAVVHKGHILDWVHVKTPWRHIGLAKNLVSDMLLITTATHLTKTGANILKKYPGVVFNPFAIN